MTGSSGGRPLLRARSGPTVGMGHVMRTRAVALELVRLGNAPRLVVDDARSAAVLAQAGLEVVTTAECPDWTDEPAGVIWLDGAGDWDAESGRLAQRGTPTFLVENRCEARHTSHRVIYPALHYVPDEWDARHAGRVLAGPGWIPLAEEVLAQRACAERDIDLLVTFGGCDPFGLTERTLEVLDHVPEIARGDFWPRTIAVAIGPHMAERRSSLAGRFGQREGLTFLPPGASLAPWIARSRAAVTAVGTTLYELAYLGVPALILANYASDHGALAWYAEHGPHLSLGVAHELSREGLRAALIAGLAEQRTRPEAFVPELGDGSRRLALELIEAAA